VTIDEERCPARDVAVEAVTLGNETVLYDERSGTTMLLNPSASVVWLLLDPDLSVSQLIADVSEIFPAVETLAAEIRQTVTRFRSLGLAV